MDPASAPYLSPPPLAEHRQHERHAAKCERRGRAQLHGCVCGVLYWETTTAAKQQHCGLCLFSPAGPLVTSVQADAPTTVPPIGLCQDCTDVAADALPATGRVGKQPALPTLDLAAPIQFPSPDGLGAQCSSSTTVWRWRRRRSGRAAACRSSRSRSASVGAGREAAAGRHSHTQRISGPETEAFCQPTPPLAADAVLTQKTARRRHAADNASNACNAEEEPWTATARCSRLAAPPERQVALLPRGGAVRSDAVPRLSVRSHCFPVAPGGGMG